MIDRFISGNINISNPHLPKAVFLRGHRMAARAHLVCVLPCLYQAGKSNNPLLQQELEVLPVLPICLIRPLKS